MKKRFIIFDLIAVSLVLLAIGCGGPSGMPEFSADSVSGFSGRTQKAKLYFSNNKWRMESEAYGRKTITIVRADKKVMWILMPDQKMYMEQKISDEHMVGRTEKIPGELERKKVGSEKVNGYPCSKYKVTYKIQGMPENTVVYQWITKNNLPIKTAAPDGSWYSEYKNIKIGKQPDSLFELPAGYKIFKLPAATM